MSKYLNKVKKKQSQKGPLKKANGTHTTPGVGNTTGTSRKSLLSAYREERDYLPKLKSALLKHGCPKIWW